MDPTEITEIIDRRRPPASRVKYAAFALVGVTLIVCTYRFFLHFTPRELAGAATAPFEKSVTLTGKFLQYAGNFLTTQHASARTEVEVARITSAEKSGPLIVAKQDIILNFTNVDERIFGTTSTDVRVAAKAFYFVPLLGPGADWKIEALEKDGVRVCVVHAPAMRVLTPISFDTRSVEIKTNTGTLRTNGQEMSDAALGEITPRLNREAYREAGNVRDAARKTIATFVKNWLQSSNSWGAGRLNAIQVIFPDEKPFNADIIIPAAAARE
ncbi:MAG: hypothetical protein JWM32_261 [Verrucomicrobia bacterium]|nr:hypothetical protein [Verrucomicrobiota bacterium]